MASRNGMHVPDPHALNQIVRTSSTPPPLGAALLDKNLDLLSCEPVSLEYAALIPSLVEQLAWQAAQREGCKRIILIMWRPEGGTHRTGDALRFERAARSLAMYGIQLLDVLVMTPSGYWSAREAGWFHVRVRDAWRLPDRALLSSPRSN